ncbi:MAG: hypothetical protein MRQ05_06220, partial [Candidatus Midichloria mitochondrii]|nr:hypothetical protein [Candidatus Midichloria mitochondrii]
KISTHHNKTKAGTSIINILKVMFFGALYRYKTVHLLFYFIFLRMEYGSNASSYIQLNSFWQK